MGKRFAGIAAVAQRVGKEMESLNKSMNLRVSAAQGQAGVDLSGEVFSSVLGNKGGFTQAEIQSTLGALGTTSGLAGNANFSELANVVSTTSSLQAQLPQLIQNALDSSTGGALGDDFANTLEESILATTGADPTDPFIKEMLASITSQLTVGTESGEVGQAAIDALVTQSLENLSQRAEAAGEAMEKIGKVLMSR